MLQTIRQLALGEVPTILHLRSLNPLVAATLDAATKDGTHSGEEIAFNQL